MLPHSLPYFLLIATSSAAWFIPPRIPRPATPQLIEPIAPAPRPIEPRPNNRPDLEVPDVPNTNSQEPNTVNGVLHSYQTTTSRVLSSAEAWKSLADSGPVATAESYTTTLASETSRPNRTARQSTSPTSMVLNGGAMRTEGSGLRMWGSVVCLVLVSVTTALL